MDLVLKGEGNRDVNQPLGHRARVGSGLKVVLILGNVLSREAGVVPDRPETLGHLFCSVVSHSISSNESIGKYIRTLASFLM